MCPVNTLFLMFKFPLLDSQVTALAGWLNPYGRRYPQNFDVTKANLSDKKTNHSCRKNTKNCSHLKPKKYNKILWTNKIIIHTKTDLLTFIEKLM